MRRGQPQRGGDKIAGIFLGLTLLASFLILGEGLGASGGLARISAFVEGLLFPAHTLATEYFGAWGKNPLNYYLVFMLIGVFIGYWVGILPGLGGGTTLALMMPFIYKMTPGEAFPFLLGMHSVVQTTGDITSILFGVPGEPTTVAVIVDGFPMTKKGEAGRALGAALMSALLGAWIGAIFLALSIPIVRPLVLAFGFGLKLSMNFSIVAERHIGNIPRLHGLDELGKIEVPDHGGWMIVVQMVQHDRSQDQRGPEG